MFSWSFSKSAEAMFSRWAIKRVCKFLLKKKLGKFILGDIDLDHLDVQLGAGTIQLSDLALNVDYINEKFGGAAAVLVKEGSVGSLTVTMPWKNGGCQVEVDELEVVLAPPRRMNVSRDESETCSHSKNGNNSSSHGLRNPDNETLNNAAANASVEVHEGVKTIAKMVKWLLTSFHVKIKKLIVAFDPLQEDQNREVMDRILVLRISELECGTHISEDASSSSFTKAHNFLGLSRLTNFLEFQGAVIELLHVDGLGHQSSSDVLIDNTIGNWYSGNSAPGNMTTIISGEKGGFSGSLKLSLPWKNGSLDIRKVDANLHILPLELRLEPSSIRCFIFMWDLIKGISEEREDLGPREPSDNLSSSRSTMHPFDKGVLGNEGFVANLMEKEPLHTLLSDSHLISDWVSKSQKGRNEEEPDFGASVDQFFECIDGLRNSQSALGNSGMWNWTCSVFSAITAASNLASGSLHVPSEQQRVETSFNASVEKVSLLLSFIDEDKKQSLKMKADMTNADFHLHRVCARFVDLDLVMQVHPREMKFELIVQHIQVVDHFPSVSDLVDYKIHGQNENPESEMTLIQRMQDGVQGALWTARESTKDLGVGHQVNNSVDVSLSMQDANGCRHMRNGKDICQNYASVTLLKTSGVSSCHVSVNLVSGSSLMGPTSFTLKLPPFVCWVYFDLVTMMLEFLKEMSSSIGTTSLGNDFVLEPKSKEYQGKFSHPRSTNMSTKKFLEGNVFLQNARIILCFPLKEHNYFSSYSSCNQFIAFDLVSPTIRRKDDRSTKLSPVASFNKRPSMTTSCSLNLNIGDFYLFYISSTLTEKIDGSKTYNRQETSFSAEKIVSIVNGTGHLFVVSMFWQEGPVTGPWIAKKAKLLASSEYGNSQDKVGGKDSEFASVTTVRDSNGFDTQTRQEMLASSAFFLHGKLPPATINLDKTRYVNISGLLNQMVEHFSGVITEPASNREEHSAQQTSILFECESVTISLAVEPVRDVKGSIRSELPSSWSSITLKVDKFELLSVSNIGGISSANFLWVSHGKGSLWGSTEGLHREFLLISCSDSTMGRGDGEGSNVLSSRYSGSDIINFWDPESNHSLTSITIKCATIVAIGGRLDWFNSIISFFILPYSDSQQSSDNCQEKNCGSSFILNLVDVGLSYEPYIENLTANQYSDLKSSDSSAKEYEDELYIACLLAASSLKLSNTTVTDCAEREYKIRLQDLGFLVCTVPESGFIGCTYSVEHLSNIGYVKVAQEANVEAVFRTNCENGHAWELECAESHIMLNTCHDTTFGLIRLAAQLQKLFAPDMQDYVAHLENRWSNVQQAHEDSEEMTTGEITPLYQSECSTHDKKSKMGNLMDEICEDVFQLDCNSDGQAKIFESHLCTDDDSSLVASGTSLPGEKTPEIIEEYFLSDLRPLSELSLRNQSSDINGFNILAVGEDRIGNGGWYGGTPLRILENHAPKVEKPDVRKRVDSKVSTSDPEHIEVVIAEGHILLKNMNVSWRMYGGFDWSNFQNTSPTLASARDVATCFELALSGLCCEYDVYPDGEISASRLSLTIRDFCVNDRSNDAPWKLVLGTYQSKKHPRKFSSKAVKLNLEAVRPDPLIRIEENRLRIALLPLLLHLHQRQLDFLISFFGGKNSSADSSSSTALGSSKSGESDKTQGHTINEEAFLPYFQKFDIWPMLVRVDYSPCHVDLTALRGGKYVELVNLIPWKGVELQLKHVQGIGLYGWSSVCETIIGEWLEDISQNQVHKLLKGLPPIKSLVAVGSGAAKLVSLPVKNYKRDHRLLKGMQRGTFAFLRSISLEAIGLGVHLAAGAHNVLLQAEYILASIPPSVPWPLESEVGNSVKSNQPNDAQQGIQQAYQSISDGLGKSASALVQTPLKKYQRGASMGSALATAVQSAPVAAISPASAAARAVHCALLGFRNSLDPEHKKESREKYLGITPPQESKQVDGGKARLQSYQMQSEIQQLLRTNRYDLCLVLRFTDV